MDVVTVVLVLLALFGSVPEALTDAVLLKFTAWLQLASVGALNTMLKLRL
jgi:hypothetical protein